MRFAPLSLLRGYREPRYFSELGTGKVELEGRAEALSVLVDPVQGEACIAIEYHAAPPSLLAVQGPGISSRAFTMSASQAVDFLLSDGTSSVLIRVPERQDDVGKVHRHLLGEYGLQLRSEVLTIVAGDLVRVRGVSDPNALPIGSPYRTPSLAGVIFAERFWVIP